MVVYCSDQTHATILKACRVLGVGHLRELPTSAEGGWALPPEALAAAIAADRAAGLTPVACVATLGTTTSCAFDDVVAIGAICQAEKIWLHIDAACVTLLVLPPSVLPLESVLCAPVAQLCVVDLLG